VASPEPAESWYAPLLANPMYWGGGLAALGLGGVLWWMMAGGGRRRKTGAALDDSIMSGGDVRPNTVIGAASGGSVNTGDTSFLTDFSQAGLGTIDTHDVDPIAEAEVYMAYGRDAQAEEILKEAIGKNPDRHEIRVKLLEIYAARRNTTAFEAVAGELYAALGSKPSPLWDKACEMGRSIDPTNPLYGGVQSNAPAVAATVAATAAVAGGAMAFDTEQSAVGATAEPEPQADPVTASTPLEFETAGHVLNFDTQSESAAAPDTGYVEMDTQGLNFDLPDLDLPSAADDALKLDLGLEEDNGPDSKFDFSGLDLDLGDAGGNELELDEVGTKLDLARAYVEMGDKEGAREILNEVLAEGSDRQKSDAKGMLSSLG
jgi:pilus assembly protein FimV